MVRNRTAGERIFDLMNIVFMVLMILIMVYPMYYVAVASVSTQNLLLSYKGVLYKPLRFTLDAYDVLFQNRMIGRGYVNTLIYLVLGTSINLLMTVLGAYVLAHRDLMFKKTLLWVCMFTMYFGGGLVPSYLWISRNLKMLDSVWVMVLPGAISTYNMLVMRAAFLAVPPSLEESARLDGAGEIVVLVRIALPLVVPTIAVITLFYAVGHWNSWFGAMIYLRTRTRFPLQLILREILLTSETVYQDATGAADRKNVSELVKYAAIVVATVPILALYPFLQRYFVKGVMLGAVKG